jgi:hypothetical protein
LKFFPAKQLSEGTGHAGESTKATNYVTVGQWASMAPFHFEPNVTEPWHFKNSTLWLGAIGAQ